jgi:hypothetical protein
MARGGRHVEACRTAERAARVLRAARLGSREARALAVGAAAALAADRPSRALVWARRAERLGRGARDPRIELSALLVQAALDERAGRVDAAFRRLIAAERCVERLRRGVTAEESRLAFALDKSEVYEALVSNRLRVGSRRAVRQALYYAERGKSRALAERLSGAADPGAFGQTPAAKALTDRLRRLERELAAAEARLESGEGTPGLRATRSVRFAGLTSTRAGILERLRREDPLGASLLGGRPPDPRAVLDALGPDDVVLEYAQSDGQFHRFVVHDGRIEARSAIARVDEVHPILERIRFLLGKGVLGEAHAARFGRFIADALRGHFERLHALLVGDAATLFDGKTVRIIPHGVLHGLPFHALEADGRALVDRCVISYAPSLAVLGLIQSRDRRRGDRPVVLGVPDAAAPAIDDEVEAVGRALGGVQVFRGAEATVAALRGGANRPEVVHVACHGFFGVDGPWQSGLRLGDAWFSLGDVYALRGTGNLVVLSGCETGRGIVYSGDEWVGLVRGFLQAGARAVVAATWEVHDQAAVACMREFYRGLGNRLGVAEALARAQRIVRRADPLPLRWAPFQVFGDPHLTLNLRKAA